MNPVVSLTGEVGPQGADTARWVRFTLSEDPATITVIDGENPLATGTIIVADPESTGGMDTQSIFLPLVMR